MADLLFKSVINDKSNDLFEAILAVEELHESAVIAYPPLGKSVKVLPFKLYCTLNALGPVALPVESKDKAKLL